MIERPSNKPQMAAAAYRLPALDQDFLLGDSTRGLRFQLEYQKAEEHLRAWGVESTVVVFGSARIRENDGSGWYEGARKFAEICSLHGGAKLDHKTPPPECHRHRRRPRHHGSGKPRRP